MDEGIKIMTMLNGIDLAQWALAHAYSDGLPVEIGNKSLPPFYYPQTEAIYLNDGRHNDENIMRLGKSKHVFTGNLSVPDYQYAIIRNGNGIGDVYWAIRAGYIWAIENNYDLTKVCVMLQPNVARIFKNFVITVAGQTITPKIVSIPVVDDDLADYFFRFWFNLFKDYVIFDCTVEGAFLRNRKDIRYLANKKQKHILLASKLSFFEHNLRVAGIENVDHTSYSSSFFKPRSYALDDNIISAMGGSVVWHLRGSDVSKWYPHMRKTADLLTANGIKTVFVGAPYDNPFVEFVLGKDNPYPVISHHDFSLLLHHVIEAKPLAYVGQETGFTVCLSHQPMRKVLLISHTAPFCFADWHNTKCLTPIIPPPCQPCWLSHANFDLCHMDGATQAAECQAQITPQQIIEAMDV